MKIKINHVNDDLWCVESKERIAIGEKYVEIIDDDDIIKTYKLENAPSDDDEDLWLGENHD
jgi:hypothetical protein